VVGVGVLQKPQRGGKSRKDFLKVQELAKTDISVNNFKVGQDGKSHAPSQGETEEGGERTVVGSGQAKLLLGHRTGPQEGNPTKPGYC